MIKLIILFILIFILLFNFDKNNQEYMINDNKWKNYRLGDILKGYCIKNKEYKYINGIKKNLPNSIGSKYLNKTSDRKDKKLDLQILNEILNDIKNKKKPNKNDIVVHLRLGDVLLDYKNDKFVYFKYKTKEYAIILENFEKTMKKIDNKKKIILVYGIHNSNGEKKKILSEIYLKKIRKILKKYNFKFSERVNYNPDDDFYFMSQSNTFIKSGGGYSKIISQIVKLNGGVVIEPNDI